MADKRTMTLNLTDAEMTALEDLAEKKELSKTAVIRQALRVYSLISRRAEAGERMVFEDPKARKKAEVLIL